jgi:hypothetical protein
MGGTHHCVLNVDAGESKACAALWATGQFTDLHIGSVENPDLDTVECLNDFQGVTRLHIMLRGVKLDLSPVRHHAHTLVRYHCNDETNPLLDCRGFDALESLSQPWHPQTVFGPCAALRELFLDRYSSPTKDLQQLPDAPQLRRLGLVRPGIAKLAPLARWPHLESMMISLARQLESVKDLAACAALKALEVDGGKHIADLSETLPHLAALERLVLQHCLALDNVCFVGKMPHLQWLNLMGTPVVDGNLTPLLEHPALAYAVFTRQKHFSHSESEVRQHLQHRKKS